MKLSEFWDLLNRHDWYYAMADDHGSYHAGQRQRQVLAAIAKQEGEAHQALLVAFAAHVFSGRERGTEKLPKPARPADDGA